MDLERLSNGDRVVVASGIALVVCSFLPWFGYPAGGRGATVNAWDLPFWGVLPTQIGLALVLVVALQRFAGASIIDLGALRWGDAFLAASATAAAIVLGKVLTGHEGAFGLGSLDRDYGLILAAVAAVGLGVGGFVKMREDRAGPSGPGRSDRESGGGESAAPEDPPPPR